MELILSKEMAYKIRPKIAYILRLKIVFGSLVIFTYGQNIKHLERGMLPRKLYTLARTALHYSDSNPYSGVELNS